MANWNKPTEEELAATLSQQEIDAYRGNGAVDGSDPVSSLLRRVAALVRTWVCMGGRCKAIGPIGTIPDSLSVYAMDFTMGKVLNRLGVPLNEDRRKALEKAEDLLDKVATGVIGVESYAEEEEEAKEDVPATGPGWAQATPERRLD